MPPKRRQTKNKAPAKLSAEDQYKREQCDLLLLDFDQLYEEKMKEAEGEMKTLINNLQTMYRINGTMKLSSVERKTNWNEYVKSKGSGSILNVSNAINSCLEDSICVKVDVSAMKSAMKTAKKRGRPRGVSQDRENEPSSAVRASTRKRNTSADASVGSETLTRTTSRARRPPGWLADATNLQTPAQARGRRGVLETPANTRDPGLAAAGLMTPMITPKCDTSNLSRTVTRLAKKDEVCFSLTGSPVAPYVTNKSKVAKAHAATHVQVPVNEGKTLNLPYNEDFSLADQEFNEEAISNLESFSRKLQESIALMKQAKSANT